MQVAYHFHAYLQLVDQGRIKLGDQVTTSRLPGSQFIIFQVDLAVPCGNMGNMVSALLARSMGLPFGKMIIACNSNNVSFRETDYMSDLGLPGVSRLLQDRCL